MKKSIKNISSIQSGIFAKPMAEGDIVYLQAKYFDDNGLLTAILHPDLKRNNISKKHLLQHGDVLFSSKGSKNFATWYEEKNLPAVASTSFFVIRLTEKNHTVILPEFLAWSINQPEAQKFLKGKATGTAMASISKTALEELEIFIPPLATQNQILLLTSLLRKEKELKARIEQLKEKNIQQQIFKAINK